MNIQEYVERAVCCVSHLVACSCSTVLLEFIGQRANLVRGGSHLKLNSSELMSW